MTLSRHADEDSLGNPHIVVFIDGERDRRGRAPGSSRATRRPGSGASASAGADFAKAIGQPITVERNRAKDGLQYGYLLKITYADGNSLELLPSRGAAP